MTLLTFFRWHARLHGKKFLQRHAEPRFCEGDTSALDHQCQAWWGFMF
jgi:hypothetical protein